MRLIDADAFKKYIEDGIDGLILPRDKVEKAIAITKGFLKDIDEQPTVELPHGEWICKGSVGNGTWCSVCDTNIKLFPNRYSFCPNCGADMRKEGEKE